MHRNLDWEALLALDENPVNLSSAHWAFQTSGTSSAFRVSEFSNFRVWTARKARFRRSVDDAVYYSETLR